MLTVIREMAEEAEVHADGTARELIAAVVLRGADAVERTPELLDVLRDGRRRRRGRRGPARDRPRHRGRRRGRADPEAPRSRQELNLDAVHQELSRYRYCTVFVVEGSGLDRAALQEQLEPLGDSLLVVGDPSAVKVHVHTDEPGAALALATAVGTLEQVEIANMHKQTERREERLLHAVPDASPLATRGRRRRRGRGQPLALREHARRTRGRGRAIAEPVGGRARRRDRARATRSRSSCCRTTRT